MISSTATATLMETTTFVSSDRPSLRALAVSARGCVPVPAARQRQTQPKLALGRWVGGGERDAGQGTPGASLGKRILLCADDPVHLAPWEGRAAAHATRSAARGPRGSALLGSAAARHLSLRQCLRQ